MDKLRTDLKIIRQVMSGDVGYIVKDPTAIKYYRFSELEGIVFTYLDGLHDYEEIGRLVTAHTGVTVTSSHVADFIDSLKDLDLIERSVGEKSLLVLERLRKERKHKAEEAADGSNVLYMRFPMFDPENFYNRLIKYVWFFWTREFFIFSTALFSLMAVITIAHWEEYSNGLSHLYSFQNKGLSDILIFVGVMFFVIVIHENAHGLTCKRYGGEVHELGFMLIYFTPAFYANVTDAWTFQSKAAKLWVSFAGVFIELIICSIATFIWYFSTPGYFTHDLAFTFMLVTGLFSVMTNMNPLIKLDGYFALVDYLDVPDLAEDASRYLLSLVRKYIFRMHVQIPNYTPRLKRILFIYGALAFCYQIFFLILVLSLFSSIIKYFFPELGIFIFWLAAYGMLRKKLKSVWNGIHNLYVDKREVLMKPKWLAATGAASAVALGLFVFLPLPYSHQTTFVIEPAERIPVRAATEGFISTVMVKEGSRVQRGELLASMRDADLEQKRNLLRSQIAMLDRSILAQRVQGATAESLADQRRREQLGEDLAETEARVARLSITAPADGVVITPWVEDKVGAMLKQGEEFCEIAKTGTSRARVRIDDWDLEDVEVGARASLWVNGAPDQEVNGRIVALAPASELHERLSPAAEQDSERERANERGIEIVKTEKGQVVINKQSEREQSEASADEATSPYEAPLTRFDALVEIETSSAEVKPGMSGEVKIYGRKRPLAMTVWEGARDWFRSKIWW